MKGVGKYDDIATVARDMAGPNSGVVLVVFGGSKGGGFSVQAVDSIIQFIPRMLRLIADEIEDDLAGKERNKSGT